MLRSLRRVWALLLAAALTLCLTSGVSAQEGAGGGEENGEEPGALPTEPTAEQYTLYKLANEAYQAEDYARATTLLRAVLELGEWNMFYLSLGRAHHRAGQCLEAHDAYQLALTANKVESPPPEQVAAKIDEYEADLSTSCPGYLEVRCVQPDVLVRVDDGAPIPCSPKFIELSPGEHTIVGIHSDMKSTQLVKLEPARRTTIAFDLAIIPSEKSEREKEAERKEAERKEAERKEAERREAERKERERKERERREAFPVRALSWAGVGVGGATLLTGVLLEVTWVRGSVEAFQSEPSNRDLLVEANDAQALNLGLYVGGAVITAAGVAGLIFFPADDSAESPGISLVGGIGGDGASIGVKGRF